MRADLIVMFKEGYGAREFEGGMGSLAIEYSITNSYEAIRGCAVTVRSPLPVKQVIEKVAALEAVGSVSVDRQIHIEPVEFT